MTLDGAFENPHRLPNDVKPTHYDIAIKTDLHDLTFRGFVKVDLEVHLDSSEVVLNTSHLDLGNALIYSSASQSEERPISVTIDKDKERVTYRLQNTLPKGSKAQLKVGFSGQLSANRTGYYRSSIEKEGKTSYYSVTQFESTSARRAFPCWDEPSLKATFAIALISREGTVNLSNMPSICEKALEPSLDLTADVAQFLNMTPNEAWKITKFDTTPKMSTYIVAFATGDFKYLETSVVMPLSGKTIPLRIYGTEDVIHQGQYTLDVIATVLPLYEKVFDVEYPLPKLDTLIVSDFDPAAMENWGLITGRYSYMLVDPEHGDPATKMTIASNQSHEVAHMWFGNITTLDWWTYVYLNEGFATLMGQIIILDKAFPEWGVASQFITQALYSALVTDANLSTHPVEAEIQDPKYTNEVFDALSYYKAASVLRMLSMYIGEETFLKGVSVYLKNNLFGNTVTKDLWDAVTAAADIDVATLMESWITKPGYPVLTVTETDNAIHVRQDLFLENGPALPEDNTTLWQVPLRALTIKDDKRSIDTEALLKEREMTLELDTSKPFKLNAGTTGFYRVFYTSERLSKIAHDAAKEGSIFSTEDRIGLIQDAFALSQAGYIKPSDALSIVVQWKHEPQQLVWHAISKGLIDISSIWWENAMIVAHLNVLKKNLFVPIVNKLGYEYSKEESMDVSFLRTLAIEQAATAGDEQVVKELKRRFKLLMKSGDNTVLAADLQQAAFISAVKFGGRDEYDAMIKIHDNPTTPAQKSAAIFGMAATQSHELIQETLRFTLEKAREQDILEFFVALGRNFKARRPLIKYFMDNYDVFYDRLGAAFQITTVVKYAIIYLSSDEDCVAIEAFFKDKDTSKYEKTLAQALHGIHARSEYIKRSTKDLHNWLQTSTESLEQGGPSKCVVT